MKKAALLLTACALFSLPVFGQAAGVGTATGWQGKDIATIAIALAAFALSIYNAVTSLLNTSNAAWVEHNKFFLEIDKQLAIGTGG